MTSKGEAETAGLSATEQRAPGLEKRVPEAAAADPVAVSRLMARQLELEAELAELKREKGEAEQAEKAAGAALEKRDSYYRAMIDSFEGFIYICAPDYRIDFMNQQMMERTGRDATGELCYSALHGLDSVCSWCVNERVMKGEQVRWELQSPKDGRWYHVSNTPIFDPDGRVLKQALITDITDRKLYEQELLENTQTLRLLMDTLPVAVSWNDRSGIIEYLNNRFVEQFGYTLEDIPTVDDWMQLAYPDPEEREYLRSLRDNATSTLKCDGLPSRVKETEVTCKDGSKRHIIRQLQLVRNRILNIYIDITERERVQEELLKIQKLESLGVLAGGIAHDFNNILTGVMGNISFARLVLATPEKADQMLQNAEKASQRAVELSRQLLTFAKGGKPVKKTVFVRQLVQESANLMLRGSSVRGVFLIPDSLHAIEADEGQINQVFNNIILNAVQAMPSGGVLTVEAQNVQLQEGNALAMGAGEYVRLSFADQGCGISKENLGRIFDPYFSTKSGGTGLGLASTQSIISRHNGHFGVSSEVGRGTTFVIHLPSIGLPYDELPPPVDLPGGSSPADGSILVMDDDVSVRNLALGMLEHLGYKATTCGSGERAIQLYRAARYSGNPFAAVIMDLTIPGAMGGKEAARQILEVDPAARLIVSSGYSNDPVLAEYRDYGFYAVLPKPYMVQELERVLAALASPRHDW
jgi:two-component system, cell cycle sensor histidine kinase and response regulator CckA